MIRSYRLGLVGVVAMGLLAGCAAESADDDGSSEAAVTSLKSYWADAKKLDLDDLTRSTVGLATDGLSDALSSGGSGITLDTPTVFAAQAEPSRVLPNSVQVQGLEEVVTGLGAQFGEEELGTEVNALRLSHMKTSSDKFYVESGFKLRAGIAKNWNLGAGGFADTEIRLGLDAGVEVSSRLIQATADQNLDTLVKSPVAAAKQLRGFVYPQSLADVKAMKPGEMFALRGQGKLGGNFGLGVPLLVAEPTGILGYRIVASAGVSAVISGQIDVQLVRLDGDQVVVDVGVDKGTASEVHAAIRDGWGIKGVCDDGQRCLREADLGGQHVDLARLVEKAVAKRLNDYAAVNIQASASTATTRVSLSRFRMHLDKGAPGEVEKALAQALKFDVRLAQAMSNRDLDQADPAVKVEFDAVRAATTSTRSFGFELLGMNIYKKAVIEHSGSFTVQTPDGARSILFDSINKHGGWFQREHGFTRTGVAAQTLDAHNPDNFRSEANLFLQVAVGDEHMDDDMLIDNIDAVILGVAGSGVVETLDRFGNELERTVDESCPLSTNQGSETCKVALLDDPVMAKLKSQGLAAIEPGIAGLADDFKKIVRDAANTRLTLQSVGLHNYSGTSGPNVSFTADVRFDDKALETITSKSKDEYRAALREYLTAVTADRQKVGSGTDAAAVKAGKDAARAQVDAEFGGKMDAMAARFADRVTSYRRIADAERLIPSTLSGKRFVSYPIGLRFTQGEDSAVISATSHERAMAAAGLFDGLQEVADGIDAPLYSEHTATLPLLALVPAKDLQLGVDVQADVKSTFWNNRERYLKAGFKSFQSDAKGSEVSTISAGMFNLDTIIKGE